MPRAGDVVAGKYRIEEIIGEGGMGAVFAATHVLTGKRVALKWMLPELAADEGAKQRFMREAQAAGRLDHPNVVDIYDVGEHDGSTFLVMEYLQGETLSAASARGNMHARDVIRLLIPAIRGVGAAHRVGVVHRDLKPDNIFLCRAPDGSYREPKVLDFGISKVAASEGQQLNPRLTRTGAVMGTPYYMSPEQIRGLDELDHRTDVYAFGVILYEALTGRVPFEADTYSALILEIATGTPKRLRELRPELPHSLEAVVAKAMAREPSDRYPDVESLARALEPFAHASGFSADRADSSAPLRATGATAATPFSSDGPVEVPVRRGSLGLVLGAAVVMLGGGLWALQRAQSPEAAEEGHVVRPGPASKAAASALEASAEHGAVAPAAAPVKDAGAAAEAEPVRAAPQPTTAPVLATPAQPAEPPIAAPPRHRPRGRPEIGTTQARPSGTRLNGRTGSLRADEF